MGASSSIVAEGLPDDLKALIDVLEGQKNRIAEHDANLLEKESTKMFKGHNVIIDELTARTKGQIRRMLEKFPNSVKHLDSLIEGGNSYAKFIKQLSIPREQIELEMVSRNDVEYDEEVLVEIIGTSSIKEIKAFDERFTKLKSYSLMDVFGAHAKKESSLYKFIERILRLDRDESKNVDKDLAVKQAEIIHKAGASRLIGVDEDPIFEILACCSRNQCACIAESYLENYNMKLERAINMKFKGNCGKLIVLWSQTVPQSIVSVLGYMTSKVMVDNSFIAFFLAKFDKDILASVDEACTAVNKKPVAEFIKNGILSSSALHRACKGWIESPSPDKGFEKILQLFLESKFPDGNIVIPSGEISPAGRKQSKADLRKPSTNDLMSPKTNNPAELAQKFKFLMEKQAQEIKLFMIDKKIKIDPNDQYVLSRSSTQQSSQNATSRSGTDNGRASENGKGTSIASFSAKQKELHANRELNDTDDKDEDEEDKLTVLTPVSPMKQPRKGSELARVNEVEEPKQPERLNRNTVFGSNYKVAKAKNAEIKEKESKAVYNYLLSYFESKDIESDGSFDGSEFWRYVRSLPLDEFGMTDDDVDTIRQFCTWENEDDGRVYYCESLFEFAESIITAIENKTSGETDVLKVMNGLMPSVTNPPSPNTSTIKLNAKKTRSFGPVARQLSMTSGFSSSTPASPRFEDTQVLSEKKRVTTVAKFPKIPLYLREYILDTLKAFDFDMNETLSPNEIESLVPSLNIPTLTTLEFFPGNKDVIAPREAAEIISKHIYGYFGDGEDHYLCLVDKGSGAYFWYNTRDESTQWADNTYYGQTEASTTAEAKDTENLGIAYVADDNEETKEEPLAEAKELPSVSANLDSKQESKKDLSTSSNKESESISAKLDSKQESKNDFSTSSNKENTEASVTEDNPSMKKAKSAEKVIDEPPSISPRLATSKSAASLKD